MQKKIARFKDTLKKLHVYRHVSTIMFYDFETAMPKGAGDEFAETMGALSEESYKLETAPEFRALVAELMEHRDELDEITRREAEELSESIARTACIPMEEYVEYQKVQSKASAVWHDAKVENDYAAFKPYLKQLIDYKRKFALYYAPDRDPYDTMLDEYEKDMDQKALDAFFAQIRSALQPLVEKVSAKRDRIRDDFLSQNYPLEQQRQLSDYVMRIMGIDRNYCSIGEVEHPFTDNSSKHDVRITTHYHEDNVISSFYSVVHEGGHALYELHTDDRLIGSPLATGTSMGIHESQSRLYENIIGRSREFISILWPKFTELFPEQLEGVTAEEFYRAVNKSVPSLIRTEADELTFCFHVMVRYELEKQLIAGTLSVDDLPQKWNELYREYLGVTVPNDTQGVLQDSHWSGGSFGYFPSYAIGSAYGAQFLHAMQKDLDVFGVIASGDLSPINAWLTERIWKYGLLKKPAELLQIATGESFDPKYFIDYITDKYNAIYAL